MQGVCLSPELLWLPACAASGQVLPVWRGGPLVQGLPQQPRSTSSKVRKAAADRRGRSVADASCTLATCAHHHGCRMTLVVCPGITFLSSVWCITLRRSRQLLTTNPSELARLQQPDPVMGRAGDNVMALLQACFQAQQKPRTTVYLSGACVAGAQREEARYSRAQITMPPAAHGCASPKRLPPLAGGIVPSGALLLSASAPCCRPCDVLLQGPG